MSMICPFMKLIIYLEYDLTKVLWLLDYLGIVFRSNTETIIILKTCIYFLKLETVIFLVVAGFSVCQTWKQVFTAVECTLGIIKSYTVVTAMSVIRLHLSPTTSPHLLSQYSKLFCNKNYLCNLNPN